LSVSVENNDEAKQTEEVFKQYGAKDIKSVTEEKVKR
jgi:hypothetical protein